MKTGRTQHRTPNIAAKPQVEVDWRAEFMRLWGACQGLVHATSTLRADEAWGNAHEEKIYVSKTSPGQGPEFARYRFARRVTYEALDEFVEAVDEIKKKGIRSPSNADQRQ